MSFTEFNKESKPNITQYKILKDIGISKSKNK